MLQRFLPLFALAILAAPWCAAGTPPARQVLVVGFDGMRPDYISELTTPHLWDFARRGVSFVSHHAVYLSATVVNGTALATGAYPEHSTVIANTDFRPALDAEHTVGIERPMVVRRGDAATDGRYLAVPTLAEILHAHGLRTVIAGCKQVALLHDRAVRPDGPDVSPVLYQGETQPAGLAAALAARLGAFPGVDTDKGKVARDRWTMQALTDVLWAQGVPPYTLLWLAEPDASQHPAGPGSPQALASIRASDAILGQVLAELDRRGLRDTTDVLVVSDHGFSTIGRKVDVAAALVAAGFDARRSTPGGLRPGEVLAVGEGGSTVLYVGGHDAAVCRSLVDFLQRQDWTGVIFSRLPVEGTFPLGAARLAAPAAPDLVVSLRWSGGRSATGAPGLQTSDTKPSTVKAGDHAGLSAYDMHAMLIAAGPDFRSGVRDPLASGNTDLAPTILWLLGLPEEAAKMDGRVLGEALVEDPRPTRAHQLRHLTVRRTLGDGSTWEQHLKVSEVDGVEYLDEGSGARQPAPSQETEE